MKLQSVGAEFFHADGQTADLTKLIVALRNFANTPHNLQKFSQKLIEM